MKNLYLVLVVLVVLPFSGFSQGENDNWVFGDYAGVQFSSSGFTPLNGSQMLAVEGVASISDAAGNLLFYTQGIKIWDTNHQIVPYNSTTNYSMTAGWSAIQGVVIVPFPGHPNGYFVFTSNGNSNKSAFSKVIVNNGLAHLVSLNTPLLDHNGSSVWSDKVENITVTTVSGGYWILIAYGTNLLAYKVNSFGVNVNPVVSSITPLVSFESHIKVSPNQDFLTVSDYQGDKFYIYNFDVTTGMVIGSPCRTMDTFFYSTAFSSQGDVIWLSDFWNFKIYGYYMNDLTSPIPTPSSREFSAGSPSSDFPTTLQRGPDGNIYVSINNSYHLDKISNPNNLNMATYQSNAVYLGGNKCNYGLPQLVPIRTCISEMTVTGRDNWYYDITYEVSDKITTVDYFALPLSSHITLNAGNYIEMLPKTELRSSRHGTILAIIEGCDVVPLAPTSQNTANHGNQIIPKPKEIYNNIQVYPNPAKNKVIVSIDKGLINSLQIISLNGLIVIDKKINSKDSYLLDINSLNEGVYILQVKTMDGKIMSTQLLKN